MGGPSRGKSQIQIQIQIQLHLQILHNRKVYLARSIPPGIILDAVVIHKANVLLLITILEVLFVEQKSRGV